MAVVMWHPGWEAKWQEIQRDDPSPTNQVIAFGRWAEGRYGVGSGGAALATEFVLTKITRDWREHNGNQPETKREPEIRKKVLQEARAGVHPTVQPPSTGDRT